MAPEHSGIWMPLSDFQTMKELRAEIECLKAENEHYRGNYELAREQANKSGNLIECKLKPEIESLIAENAKLREAAVLAEWGKPWGPSWACPVCQASKERGHHSGCRLREALGEEAK